MGVTGLDVGTGNLVGMAGLNRRNIGGSLVGVRQGGDHRGTGGQGHDDGSEVLHVERMYIQIPNRKQGVVECNI